MCLAINNRWHPSEGYNRPQPLTAKKDITVYKLLAPMNGVWKSPHQHCRFDKGFIYSIPAFGLYGTIGDWHVEEGLHAFSSYKEAKWWTSQGRALWEAIIPKGSLYYRGLNGEIVSNQIQIIKIKFKRRVPVH